LTAPLDRRIDGTMPRKEASDAARIIAGECLAMRIRRLDRSLSRIYEGALRPHGLTIAQLGLLAAVASSGPVQPSRLGEILDLERSTVSRNVALLLRKGWVSAVAVGNGRSQLLAITRRGENLLNEALPAWRRAQKNAEELLTPQGVLAFLRVTRPYDER
jgi:DNA-binding MarR family transcriptional regulator